MRTSVGRDAIFIINSVHAVDADKQYVTNAVAVVEMFLREYYGGQKPAPPTAALAKAIVAFLLVIYESSSWGHLSSG